jgi:hypothetical protein
MLKPSRHLTGRIERKLQVFKCWWWREYLTENNDRTKLSKFETQLGSLAIRRKHILGESQPDELEKVSKQPYVPQAYVLRNKADLNHDLKKIWPRNADRRPRLKEGVQ